MRPEMLQRCESKDRRIERAELPRVDFINGGVASCGRFTGISFISIDNGRGTFPLLKSSVKEIEDHV
jgi:hypothetical protein